MSRGRAELLLCLPLLLFLSALYAQTSPDQPGLSSAFRPSHLRSPSESGFSPRPGAALACFCTPFSSRHSFQLYF
uniref:Uncharacterized protein n=1 Tax=Anguilla anguilla TaxID=7936 RepID=A0A0E9XNL9_ANGAN